MKRCLVFTGFTLKFMIRKPKPVPRAIQTLDEYISLKNEQERIRNELRQLEVLALGVEGAPVPWLRVAFLVYRQARGRLTNRLETVSWLIDQLNLRSYAGRMRMITEDESWTNRSKAYSYMR